MDQIAPDNAKVDQRGAADRAESSSGGSLLGSFQELDRELALARSGRNGRPVVNMARNDPKTAEDCLTTGFTHLDTDDYAAALAAFERAKTLQPNLAIAHSCCALALQFMQRPAEAAKAASIALEQDPDDLVGLKVQARIQLDEGRLVDVVRNCRRIQRISSNDQDANSMLSQASGLYFGLPDTGNVDEQSGGLKSTPTSGGHDDGAAQGLPQFDVGRPITLDWGLTLEIGRCSYIHDCRIRNPAKAKTHIRIGKFCSIATDLTIIGYDHRTDWITTFPFLDQWNRAFWPGTTDIASQADPEIGGNKDRGDVQIGNDVWIGYNVKLFKGVKVGDGAVIGACSLVRRDVPPFTIVAGSPARVIRQRFSDADRDFLLDVKWWDWPAEKINRMIPLLCAGGVTALRHALQTQPEPIE